MADPFRRGEELKEISEVNVVPLADVSLVLLIILLVLSPMMTQAMLRIQAAGRQDSAAEPQPAEPERDEPRDLVLAVALGPDGVSVGGRSFQEPGEFAAFMTEELARRTEKKTFLIPHLDAPHGRVVDMIETLKDCGASAVALVQVAEPVP